MEICEAILHHLYFSVLITVILHRHWTNYTRFILSVIFLLTFFFHSNCLNTLIWLRLSKFIFLLVENKLLIPTAQKKSGSWTFQIHINMLQAVGLPLPICLPDASRPWDYQFLKHLAEKKAEVLSFSYSVFNGNLSSHTSCVDGQQDEGRRCQVPPTLSKDQSMWLDEMHPRALRDLAHVDVKPLSMIF